MNTLRPNEIKRACSAGTVEHAWVPPLTDDSYVSVSAPRAVCLAFSGHHGCVVTTAGKTARRDVEPGNVSITGGEPIYWRVVKEWADIVEVIATTDVRRAIAHEMRVPHAAELDDLHGAGDGIFWAIAVRLRTSLRSRAIAEDLEREELIWHLYRHIFASRFGGRDPGRGDGKLSRRRQERVTDYIEAHLSDAALSVGTMAEVASLSPFHFLRSFKRTFHMTPHRYVTGRRLELVRMELAKGGDAAELARTYGFRHARHFSRVYEQHHGVAPGREPAFVCIQSGVAFIRPSPPATSEPAA